MRRLSVCGDSLDASVRTEQATTIKLVRTREQSIRVYSDGSGFASQGLPTVVFENGLGSEIQDWGSLLPRVAEFAPVVAYDRPGLGGSEASDYRPTAQNVAALLHGLLTDIGAAPPYVLVGFSLGGPYVRMYAALYEHDVSGIVYIDPLDFTETREESLRAFAEIGSGEDGLREYEEALDLFMRESRSDAAIKEWEEARRLVLDGFSEFNQVASTPTIPQVLLVSTKDQSAFRRFTFDFTTWAKVSKRNSVARLLKWISAVEDGHFALTPSSPHKIHGNDQALVLWAIRRLVFPDLSKRLRILIDEVDEEDFVTEYRILRAKYPPESLGEDLLNTLGYELLWEDKPTKAMTALRLNVEEYPAAWNPYDSLAEVYMAQGELELSIANYRRSLELNPKNANAEKKLKELEGRLISRS